MAKNPLALQVKVQLKPLTQNEIKTELQSIQKHFDANPIKISVKLDPKQVKKAIVDAFGKGALNNNPVNFNSKDLTQSLQRLKAVMREINTLQKANLKTEAGSNLRKEINNQIRKLNGESGNLRRHITALGHDLNKDESVIKLSEKLQRGLARAQIVAQDLKDSLNVKSEKELLEDYYKVVEKISTVTNKGKTSDKNANQNATNLQQLQDQENELRNSLKKMLNISGLKNSDKILDNWLAKQKEYIALQARVKAADADTTNAITANANKKAQAEANAVQKIQTYYAKVAAAGTKIRTLKERGADVSSILPYYTQFQNNTFNPTAFMNNGSRDAVAQLEAIRKAEAMLAAEIDKVSKRYSLQNETISRATGFANLSAQIERFIRANDNLKSNQGLLGAMKTIQKDVNAGTGSLKEHRKAWAECVAEAERLGLTTLSASQKIVKLFKEHFNIGIATTGLNLVRTGMQQLYQNIVDVDTAMTELRKVTTETDSDYNSFLDRASGTSRELATSISDYVNSTAEWARLGYGIGDAEELARVSVMFKNVGDGIESSSEAASYLISIMKGFGKDAKEATDVLDKINQVANTQPISAQGIGEVLKRSSSALSSANTTLEESIALGTAMNSVVQDVDKVGTTLKTSSMFLRATKTELEESGESAEGMAVSISELRSQIKLLTKETSNPVDIFEDENTYKSMYQVYKELSKVYNELTDTQQATLLNLLGGKRNANAIEAVLQNFEIAESSMRSMSDAAGSAERENAKYLDSIAGKTEQLKSSFQGLSVAMNFEEIIKFFIDGATAITDMVSGITDLTGGVSLLAGAFTFFLAGRPKMTGSHAYARNTLVVTRNELCF